MAKRIKSKKYTGVYYRELEDGDRVFEFTYKNLEGKKKWIKVGLASHNINESFANRKRIETINKLKLDGDEPDFIKKRKAVKKISLNAVANKYFADYEMRAKLNIFKESLFKYQNKVEPYFGKMPVDEITKEAVEKWLKSFKKDYKQASINSYHATFKAVVNYGIKEFKELERVINPLQKISMKDPENERERVLSTNEIKHLFECLIHKPKAYLYVAVALGTGARPKAIITTQKKDFDIANRTLTFPALKKGKRYPVPLIDSLYKQLIEATKDLNADDYIFHPDNPKTITTRPISYEGIKRQIQPLLDDLFNQGLDNNDRKHRVTFYTFRHTFATHLVKNPHVNILDVKKLMSHSRLQMTERYAKVELHQGTQNALNNLYSINDEKL
ncbi:MAG: tyrosine-type recombinase/integrase [Arcobacter sp.]|uniref:tyrosine-type recombinase/integrase n=1 Tax=Arcobacter sp. TaxID=1872629 RepID=UPI003D041389|nr:tyrosine-type recombinase/integrase [Aliarcobacter sp.]